MSTATTPSRSADDAGWRRVESHDGTPIGWRVDGPKGVVTRGRVVAGEVAVVLCNGITCDDTYWRHIWEPLAAHSPVVRFDYRGHSRSEAPVDDDAVAVEDTVGDMLVVLEAARVERAVFVGHSYGVKVAWEAWRHVPDRVAGLVGAAGSVLRPLPMVGPANPGVFAFELLRALMAPKPTKVIWERLLNTPAVAFPVARALGFVGPKADRDDMADWFAQLSERDMSLMLRMMRKMQEHSGADLLTQIEAPAVVMMGARDLYTPPLHGKVMARRMPDARCVVVPTTTHVLPIEEPELVVNGIRRVLRRAGGTAPPD